jgi:hypothetical protein
LLEAINASLDSGDSSRVTAAEMESRPRSSGVAVDEVSRPIAPLTSTLPLPL